MDEITIYITAVQTVIDVNKRKKPNHCSRGMYIALVICGLLECSALELFHKFVERTRFLALGAIGSITRDQMTSYDATKNTFASAFLKVGWTLRQNTYPSIGSSSIALRIYRFSVRNAV